MGFLDRIGNTPLLEVEGLFVKLECANPGGSLEDRIAHFMLSVGLTAPAAEHGSCPLRCECEARGRALIGSPTAGAA